MPAQILKMAKTEYDELWERVTKNINMEGVFSRQDIRNKLNGKQGPAAGDGNYFLGEGNQVIEQLIVEKAAPIIQQNLADFYADLPKVTVVPSPEEKTEIERAAEGAKTAYTKEKEKEVLGILQDVAEEQVTDTLRATGADKEDIEAVAKLKAEPESLPQYQQIKAEAEKTLKLAKKAERPSTVGIYRRDNALADVLEAFQEPRSSEDAAKYLREKNPDFQKGKGTGTIARDIRRFQLAKQGYTKIKGNKQTLTKKGREYLEQLRK
jgi:hypothetical protein